MNQSKLITTVKQYPEIWDRSSDSFREKQRKHAAWEQVAKTMDASTSSCRDIFKSLREKYIREREKQSTFRDHDNKYQPWEHLDKLHFLDPHILLRKQSLNHEEDRQTAEEFKAAFDEDATLLLHFSDVHHHPPGATTSNNGGCGDFDKTLIALVRKATPIWDRKSSGYPSKELKHQLWKTIAQTMHRDMSVCMLRWKGLREKYIRQRDKYQDGEGKWEFLDEMAFLDKVISYRRKATTSSDENNEQSLISHPQPIDLVGATFHPSQFYQQQQHTNNNKDNKQFISKHLNDNDDIDLSLSNESSTNSISNHYPIDTAVAAAVKQEKNFENNYYDLQQHTDSSYDSGVASSSRKRSASDDRYSSDCSTKQDRTTTDDYVNNVKTPEQVFGDLVAALLSKKTERDKSFAMIEIMKVLTK